MIIPDYPSMYFDTLVRLFMVVERWLYRVIIRHRIKAILDMICRIGNTESFFTVPVLDEGNSYCKCYFVTIWARHIHEGHTRQRSLYLTRVGGLLVQVEPRGGTRGDLQRLHPDDGLPTPVLRRLLKALQPAYRDAMSRCRDHGWEKGEYVAW